MEDGLVPTNQTTNIRLAFGLNPCCNGRWSRTIYRKYELLFSVVLILVVMEDGLVHNGQVTFVTTDAKVLILVVMEDGLVRAANGASINVVPCLNPCCNGRWSRTSLQRWIMLQLRKSLNPCCNGRWSRTFIPTLVVRHPQMS